MINKNRHISVEKTIRTLSLFLLVIGLTFFANAQTSDDYFLLGMSKYNDRNFDSAEYYFNKALELKPDFADAAFRKGLAEEKSGKTEKAFEDYSLAIQIEPKAVYYNNRGMLRFVDGENSLAIQDYDSAIALDPDYLIALYNKGRVYIELEEFKVGCECMQDAYKRGLLPVKDAVDYYCN